MLGGGSVLVAYKRQLTSNVDRMAWSHLVAIGAIREKERASKKPSRTGRIAWKRLDATGKLGCDQCGGSGASSRREHPYGMKLCRKCFAVHLWSEGHGLKPNEDISW